MHNFAKLLNKLYFTYSYLAKEELLQQFFAATPDPDRGYALAIMAGTLEFPAFKRSVVKNLIQERTDPVLFALSYDYVGDLSETVALLWPETNTADNAALPSLSELIAAIHYLSASELPAYLTDLLNQCNSNERWALLKLGTGSLRIGISARFLKKTLAKFGNVDITAIEKTWHALQPPYLELFSWLEGKTSPPDITNNVYFHPVMLAHPLEDNELTALDHALFAVERKYDGIRVQLACSPKGKALYSRSGDNIGHAFPEILSAITTPVVLDGELVIQHAEGVGSFNDLQQRLNRKVPSKKLIQSLPAAVILYDILSADGIDLTPLPFNTRRQALEKWLDIHQPPNTLLSELLTITANQTLAQLREQILAEQHIAVEGLMLKRHDSSYIAGRPKGYWYKWKRDPNLIDAVLLYAQRGHGKRSSFYSDYTFGLWENNELLPIGKAYSGFTDAELQQLDKWIRHHTTQRFGPVREVEKSLVLEVAFDAANFSRRHKSGVALRFPRINRIRWDKPANEADTLANLKNLIK